MREENELLKSSGSYVKMDVMNKEMLHLLVIRQNNSQMFHIASITK